MEVFKSNIGGEFNGGLEVYDRETSTLTYCPVNSYNLVPLCVGTNAITQYIKNFLLMPLFSKEVI